MEARAIALLTVVQPCAVGRGRQFAFDLRALQALLRVRALGLVVGALQLHMRHQAAEAGIGQGKCRPCAARFRPQSIGPGPRPLPLCGPRSRRKNGLVRLASCSGGTPVPWSRTLISTHSSRPLAAMSTWVTPASGVLP